MIWNLIGSIGRKVLDIVDGVVEDNDEANRVKLEIQRQLIENKSSELEASAKIVLAEAQGSWLQRNWRPLLMVTFAGLVATDNRLGLCLGFCLPFLGTANDCFHSQYIGASNFTA